MAPRVVAVLFICLLAGQEVSAMRSSKVHFDSYQEMNHMNGDAMNGLNLGSDGACDKEAFLAEHQGIIDEVEKLANNCKDAVEETEEFAQSGVKLKAKCVGKDVDVNALIKRVTKYQALFQASRSCPWAEEVAKEMQTKGLASKIGANLRYIYENAPEIDDDVRGKYALKFEEIEDLKISAETAEQFQTDAQEAAARFGPGDQSLSELRESYESHKARAASASDSKSEEADELVAGSPCWRQRRNVFKNGFDSLTGCGKDRGCFQLDFGADGVRSDKAHTPTDDDMLKAQLVNGTDPWSITYFGLGVKRNEYNTWGICLPKTNGEEGVHRGFAAWKRGVKMTQDVAQAILEKESQGGSLMETNRTDTQWLGTLTTGLVSSTIMIAILVVAFAIWIPMKILEIGVAFVSIVGWLLLWWCPLWWIVWGLLIFAWCLAKALVGMVVGLALGIIYFVGYIFALAAAGLDTMIGQELNAIENYEKMGAVGLALTALAFSCDTSIENTEES